MTDQALRRTVWLFILIWLCVGAGVAVVGSVAVIGWLIAQTVDVLVAIAMAVTGR